VGGCTRRVQTAWLCLGSLVERPWLALEGSFLFFFGINKLRSKPSYLVGPPFLAFTAFFFSYARLAFLERLDQKFVDWWVWLESRICLRWLKLALGEV